jgi:hypothetical protein
MQLLLEFDRDSTVWKFISYLSGDEKREDKLTPAIIAFLADRKEYTGTATELIGHLKEFCSTLDFKPNSLSRTLKDQTPTLEKHGVNISFNRSENARLITLSTINDDDD